MTPNSDFNHDWSRIARYIDGEATAEEAAQTERQLAGDPILAREIESLREARAAVRAPMLRHAWNRDEVLARVLERSGEPIRLDVENSADDHSGRAESVRSSLRRGMSVAHVPRRPIGVSIVASAAALTILGAAALQYRGIAHSESAIDHTYATTSGRQAVVTLSSGTQVILGPATTLRVHKGATAGTIVTLTGQAFFTVAPKDRATFTVRTANAVARVLGTAFSVRRYEEDRVARIVVTDGRVSLQGTHNEADQKVVLAARSIGVVDDSGNVRVTTDVTVSDYTAWTDGLLVFRKTPVREIVTDLSRAYGADIRLTDSVLARQTLTWSIPLTKITLSGALDALTVALGAHIVQRDSALTIVPGPSIPKNGRHQTPFTVEKVYGR